MIINHRNDPHRQTAIAEERPKMFRLHRYLKPCLPDTSWGLLPTEL